MNMLFNKVLCENEKHFIYFYLKTEERPPQYVKLLIVESKWLKCSLCNFLKCLYRCENFYNKMLEKCEGQNVNQKNPYILSIYYYFF